MVQYLVVAYAKHTTIELASVVVEAEPGHKIYPPAAGFIELEKIGVKIDGTTNYVDWVQI